MENPKAGQSFDLDLVGPGQPTSLSNYLAPPEPWDPDKYKAQSATRVANWIVWTFAGTIGLVLVAIASIVLVTKNPDDAKRYTDTLVAILESLGKFLTAVFGPLLAFILGYYFSEKQKNRNGGGG